MNLVVKYCYQNWAISSMTFQYYKNVFFKINTLFDRNAKNLVHYNLDELINNFLLFNLLHLGHCTCIYKYLSLRNVIVNNKASCITLFLHYRLVILSPEDIQSEDRVLVSTGTFCFLFPSMLHLLNLLLQFFLPHYHNLVPLFQ